MDEFQELLGARKEPFKICLPAAKEMMCRGLRYFIGDDAKWLQGYDDIAEWLEDNKGRGLLLYGANGRGKSIMCFNIMPTLICYYYKQIRIFKCRANNLRTLLNSNNDYYNAVGSKIIFIDDFGTESISNLYGEKVDVFSDIVDLAEQEKKILVLTTNLATDEIKNRYGIRTFDRLRAITHAICLRGESMRRNTI